MASHGKYKHTHLAALNGYSRPLRAVAFLTSEVYQVDYTLQIARNGIGVAGPVKSGPRP